MEIRKADEALLLKPGLENAVNFVGRYMRMFKDHKYEITRDSGEIDFSQSRSSLMIPEDYFPWISPDETVEGHARFITYTPPDSGENKAPFYEAHLYVTSHKFRVNTNVSGTDENIIIIGIAGRQAEFKHDLLTLQWCADLLGSIGNVEFGKTGEVYTTKMFNRFVEINASAMHPGFSERRVISDNEFTLSEHMVNISGDREIKLITRGENWKFGKNNKGYYGHRFNLGTNKEETFNDTEAQDNMVILRDRLAEYLALPN